MNLTTTKKRLDAIKPSWRDLVPSGYDPDEILAHLVNAFRAARSDQPGLTVEDFFANIRSYI